jgi:hypothetical protein
VGDCIVISVEPGHDRFWQQVPNAIPADDAEHLAPWIKHFNGDLSAVERVVNHKHLNEVLDCACGLDALTKDDWELLAATYVAILRSELARICPNGAFEINTAGDPLTGEDPSLVEITFWKVRDGNTSDQ